VTNVQTSAPQPPHQHAIAIVGQKKHAHGVDQSQHREQDNDDAWHVEQRLAPSRRKRLFGKLIQGIPCRRPGLATGWSRRST
jgi:hypothetical protein